MYFQVYLYLTINLSIPKLITILFKYNKPMHLCIVMVYNYKYISGTYRYR